jgi:hypothetical protein
VTKRHELECGLHRLATDVVFGTRPRPRLLDGLAGEDAERDRDWQRSRELGQRPRDRVGEDVEMGGLSSDQAAERNDGVETPRSREHRDRGRQLKGAGDLELLDLRAFGQRRLNGALGERARDLVVPARTHDRDACAGARILHPGRSLPRSRHLPQSSPRMQPHRRVTK